jgi:hypothetical protein
MLGEEGMEGGRKLGFDSMVGDDNDLENDSKGLGLGIEF